MTTERKQKSGGQGQGKDMTAKDCKQTLGMNGNIVCLDCDGIFTFTTETGG